ncbi:Ribosomal RNA processing protein [Penicillium paradoxum]|uniref:Ribosomal RNA processing protein n=1 Tax=Penicillium paradoxum TaxID=176176 RepID=UPI0025490BAC|nr:Ribosomal RNA processing protein [Penicillium paradoxum]KAJ5793967.1 Ribosomal RNA processing protein [Penicillium paradoxum]
MDGQKTPFVRELGSSDRKVRDKAVDSLTQFVRSRTDLTLVDLLKLWKGLFYCFYHSDRPLTQQALARALSYSLVPSLPQATLHRFLRAFWITIGRDYHALDRIRLDKYLMLIRFYVGVAFEIFQSRRQKRKREDAAKGRGKKQKKQEKAEVEDEQKDGAEDLEAKFPDLAAYISIIEEGPLCPLNYDEDQPKDEGDPNYVPMPHGPDGLRYHLIDIWIDELEKVLEFEEVGDEETPKRKIKGDVPMELILRPLEKLRAESAYKPVRTRAAEALEDERLFEWGIRTREVEEEESEEEWGGFE